MQTEESIQQLFFHPYGQKITLTLCNIVVIKQNTNFSTYRQSHSKNIRVVGGQLSYASRLMVILYSNFQVFITMVTGVGFSQILLPKINLPTIKIPCSVQEWGHIASFTSQNFLLRFPNFNYHGNRDWPEANFICTVKFSDPQTPFGQESITDGCMSYCKSANLSVLT